MQARLWYMRRKKQVCLKYNSRQTHMKSHVNALTKGFYFSLVQLSRKIREKEEKNHHDLQS